MARSLVYLCLLFNTLFILAGVSLTLSALMEGKNFNQGGHKIGLGVEFEA